jgi:hypothetical protein
MMEINMGIVLGTIIYKAGARRANKKRDKQEKARGEKSANKAMHEYYNGDTSAMEEYYANR